ncbi:MAG: toll/interleukin-1 receptor domain-containing protein [Victivallaceae bacterium]|nr:toll/interleukin-1 receptor domain-containing protein [Victivallaceae bacterium]
MIFLSHNSLDKTIVREIACRLVPLFGQDNIFYDEWSIQPGDSIIGKMDEGLSKCRYFFFFVSQNSIKSKMVTLEWQAALLKMNQQLKFIPIRLDNCLMPTILTSILYIDLFTNGVDVAIRQMLDVIQGQNTFRNSQTFSNLSAILHYKSDNSATLEIRAEYYMEPHSIFLLLFDNIDNIEYNVTNVSFLETGDGKSFNFGPFVSDYFMINTKTATSPNFPTIVDLKTKDNKKLVLNGVMHAISHNKFSLIPCIKS